MFMAGTILYFLFVLPSGVNLYRTCVPNTHYVINGRVCICDRTGHWNDLYCHKAERRQLCKAGQIIWENCTQCICQDNGELVCSSNGCDGYYAPSVNKEDSDASPSCTPFRSYYVNCSLCECPASGQTREARCATDKTCDLKVPPSESDLISGSTLCIPNVMYLFPCLHCLCTNDGKFVQRNCVDMCYKTISEPSRRCIPRSFYRKDCNVCRCPGNSVPDNHLCTTNVCTNKSKFTPLHFLSNKTTECVPHEFTKPRCIYCDCDSDGSINPNACLELECLETQNIPSDVTKTVCNPGEVYLICIECFCPSTGRTIPKYCTKGCSLHNKLSVLEVVLKENLISHLIEKNAVKTLTMNDKCAPNSLYVDQGKYCLCSENGNTNFKLCTSISHHQLSQNTSNLKINRLKLNNKLNKNKFSINANTSCEPNTFVDFDCNTCYCGKNAKIDPKWCTYDDCEAKRIILDGHNSTDFVKSVPTYKCTPGTIYKSNCNLCICPESGEMEKSVCSKDYCQYSTKSIKFVCEPLAYYQVDCNICYCPQDGLKNVAKCTKNECEKNFLRSDFCVAGELFSDDCNICVCPPNGEKVDKVCTNYTCSEFDTPWKKIFTLSQSLMGNHADVKTSRGLDLCYPGEEFVVGCKVCVCPDMGLREYAECTTMLCDETYNGPHYGQDTPLIRSRRALHNRTKDCKDANITSDDFLPCTPGSMYIVRCQKCVCPYKGPLILFCQPLPEGTYCEEAFPNVPYEPVLGRRNPVKGRANFSYETKDILPKADQMTESPALTAYQCQKDGEIQNECFLCHCVNGSLIEEHCFKNVVEGCNSVEPAFLDRENKVVFQ